MFSKWLFYYHTFSFAIIPIYIYVPITKAKDKIKKNQGNWLILDCFEDINKVVFDFQMKDIDKNAS